MKIIVLGKYYDKKEKRYFNIGDIIEVSEKRFKELLSKKINVMEYPDVEKLESEIIELKEEIEKLNKVGE